MAQEKAEKSNNRYFPHDIEASSDEKFAEMNYFFRHLPKDIQEKYLSADILAYAGLGIYWKTVEHLHKHSIKIDKLHFLADEWRIDLDFFKTILENFDLFQKNKSEYFSKRVLKNLEEQKKRSEIAKARINKRWNPQPKEKTEEEKRELKKAEDYLNEGDNIPLNQTFTTMYQEYQSLDYVKRKKAIEHYKEQIENGDSKTISIKKMLKFIKEEFHDKQEK